MKRNHGWVKVMCIGLILAGLLSGCSVGQSAAGSQTSASGAAGTSGAAGQLSPVMQLAIGTLKLKGTDQAVDAAQAAKLLPLWKAARGLGKSETTAAAESNGLVKQIQQTMTSEQMQAIQGMGLSMQNLPTIAQELGIEIGPAGMSAPPAAAGTASASGGGAGGMGGPPDMGGMSGGPGGPPPGMSSNGSTLQTAKSGSNEGSFLGLNPALLNAVIQMLETRAQ